MTRSGLALLAMLASWATQAVGAPALVPRQDVSVTYRTEQGGHVLEQQMRWSAKSQRLRIDPPAPGMFVLVDYVAHRMQIVQERDRSFMEMDAPASLPSLGAPSSGLYTQGADDRVAGLACTEWTLAAGGEPAGICVTEDGVLLRVRMGTRTLATASVVNYAPQDLALFRVPDGYTRAVSPR